jgi:hypothetical protein
MDFFIILPIGKCVKPYLKLAQSPKPSPYHHYTIILTKMQKLENWQLAPNK